MDESVRRVCAEGVRRVCEEGDMRVGGEAKEGKSARVLLRCG